MYVMSALQTHIVKLQDGMAKHLKYGVASQVGQIPCRVISIYTPVSVGFIDKEVGYVVLVAQTFPTTTFSESPNSVKP